MLSKALDNTIGVNRRETQGIGQFALGQGKVDETVFHQADHVQPCVEFTEEVRRAALGVATPHTHEPFADHGFLDQGGPPQGA